MSTADKITGLILAGGAGRRVNGHDKGLLKYKGRPLIRHVVERLTPQVDQLIISCNRNLELYSDFGLELLGDFRDGFQGPLAGLEPLAGRLDDRILVVAPCDMPGLPADLVARLVAALHSCRHDQPDVSFAHDGSRGQYLCAAIRGPTLSTLQNFLDCGQRSVHQWYAGLNSVAVDFSDEAECFHNLNTLEAL